MESDRWREELDINGYTELGPMINKETVQFLRETLLFEQQKHIATHGEDKLRKYGEVEMLRSCHRFNDQFRRIVTADWTTALINCALNDRAILHGYHGIISNSQSSGDNAQPFRFHRDSPWFRDTRVCLLILMPLVDFVEEVGPTEIVPGSHLFEHLPSQAFMEKHGRKMLMPAGHVFAMDGTLAHRGAPNVSGQPRPLLQMNITVAFFKQQIDVWQQDEFDWDWESDAFRDRIGQRVRSYSDPDEMLTDDRKWKSGNYDVTNCRIRR